MVTLNLLKRDKWAVFLVLSYAVLTRLWSVSYVLGDVQFLLGASLTEISGMKN